jgi:hypothetical protein
MGGMKRPCSTMVLLVPPPGGGVWRESGDSCRTAYGRADAGLSLAVYLEFHSWLVLVPDSCLWTADQQSWVVAWAAAV